MCVPGLLCSSSYLALPRPGGCRTISGRSLIRSVRSPEDRRPIEGLTSKPRPNSLLPERPLPLPGVPQCAYRGSSVPPESVAATQRRGLICPRARRAEPHSGRDPKGPSLAQPPAAKEPDLRWIDGPYCEGWEDVGRGERSLIRSDRPPEDRRPIEGLTSKPRPNSEPALSFFLFECHWTPTARFIFLPSASTSNGDDEA